MIERTTANVSSTGSCLCGAVSFKVNGRLRDVVDCHCGQCRRFNGHFAAYTAVSRSEVTIRDVEHRLKWYSSSQKARRGFCAQCGSSLFWDEHRSKLLRIAAGTLDQPTGLRTVAHIFTRCLADYYTLTDDLEKRLGSLAD